MLPDDKQFDQLVRERLLDHSSPVRTEIWHRIRSRISRRRRRFGLWLIFATLPAVLVVFFAVRHRALLRADSDNQASTKTRTAKPIVSGPRKPGEAIAISTSGMPAITNRPISRRTISRPTTSPRPISNLAKYPPAFDKPPGDLAAVTFATHLPQSTLPALARLGGRTFVNVHPPVPGTPLGCPNPDAGSSFFDHFYLSLFGAADLPSRNYTFSYTGGVRLTYQVTPQWSVTSGLQYSRVGIKTPVPNCQTCTFDSLGMNITVKNIDLPLLLGYTIIKDKYTLTINGGAIFNLYSGAPAFVSYFNLPRHLTPGAYLGFAYTRTLTDQWSVFAEPYFRIRPSGDPGLLPAHTWWTGLQLGLRYHL